MAWSAAVDVSRAGKPKLEERRDETLFAKGMRHTWMMDDKSRMRGRRI
jgi:hypothetical protein